MPAAIDMTGKKYSFLTAIRRTGTSKHKKAIWLFICDCGNEKEIVAESVRGKLTHSCGCHNVKSATERATTHGMNRSREHLAWKAAKSRCSNPNYHAYHRYGGRGISVCERWINSFENFYEDMGPCPENLTLERIDNDKGYSLENCKWATRREQALNRG